MSPTEDKKPFFGFTGRSLVLWITLACSADMMMFGYDQGVFSGTVITPDFLRVHNLEGPSKTTMLSTVTAIYDIGCFVGALGAFTLGEKLGRKKSILVGTTIMVVGVALKVSSFSLGQMFAGRIVLGIGNGINTATAPLWQCETAPVRLRGKLVMLELGMNVGGYMIVNWINYGLSFEDGPIAWRLPLSLQFVFIIFLYATIPWLPESPRWLMSHDKPEEARLVLACLEGKSKDDPAIILQVEEIQYLVDYEREHALKWGDLLKSNVAGGTKPLRRLLLGAGTQFIQQFEGINIMSYYMPSVLINAVGLTSSRARLISAINSITYFLFTFLAVYLIEKVGRRTLMLASTAGQCLTFLIICVLLRFAEGGNQAIATASVPFFFLYFIAFAIGMLGVPWLYPTEINSLSMRTKGASAATATNWITNYIIVQITPIGIQNLAWRFWIVFVVFNAAFMPVIYFLYPETANRTLEDIDQYYHYSPPLVVTGDKDVISSKRPQAFVDKENAEIDIVRRTSSIAAADIRALSRRHLSVSHVQEEGYVHAVKG